MRWLAIFLTLGGFSGGLASTSVGQDLAHAQEPAKTEPAKTSMVFMTDHGAGIVLSVSRCEGFVILEGPADHVALVRDGLVRSGLSPGTIITRPVESTDARGL
ncbi:MAG: hypothetical protein ACT4O6_11800 [Reyranella sp.]